MERVVLIKLSDDAPAPREVAEQTLEALSNHEVQVSVPRDAESVRSWDLRLVITLPSLEADASLRSSASWLTWRAALPAIVVKTWVFGSFARA